MSSKPECCESMTIFPSANVCSICFNAEGLFATFHQISEQYDRRHQVLYKSISEKGNGMFCTCWEGEEIGLGDLERQLA